MDTVTACRNRFEFMRGSSDCVRAAFASVLNIAYEDMPEIDPRRWQEQINEFLYDRGFSTINVKLSEGSHPPLGLHVASIESIRGDGFQHCVVVRDGEIIFDPELRESNGKPTGKATILEYTVIYPLDYGWWRNNGQAWTQ